MVAINLRKGGGGKLQDGDVITVTTPLLLLPNPKPPPLLRYLFFPVLLYGLSLHGWSEIDDDGDDGSDGVDRKKRVKRPLRLFDSRQI